MARRMLIDASHPEETRVVVVDGTRLEEFDFETATRKPLKGNIYLAKVIRIEPSLQAAFVEYGGNRHGFLAFAEIHPDYYQIPVADRERLIAEHQRLHAEADDEPEAEPVQQPDEPDDDVHPDDRDAEPVAESIDEPAATVEASDAAGTSEPARPQEASPPLQAASDAASVGAAPDQAPVSQVSAGPSPDETPAAQVAAPLPVGEPAARAQAAEVDGDRIDGPRLEAEAPEARTPDDMPAEVPEGDPVAEPGDAPAETVVETLGGDEAAETREKRERRRRHSVRQYKIQEVIKRRQILLVQVVKEERGNKGAALTTYLSLAGRYCVLMPNAGRGGGISRKISNPVDRKRMKEVLSELDVPQGMGVILRTAGLERSPIDIRRDYEYLSRLWDSIRELTMRSTAPALIYEEGDLIKRSLRDVYDTDIAQVLVEGEAGFTAASEFMRQLVPHQASKVELYREPIPLFHRYQVESQFDAMHSPTVQLRSGGYIVINPTEALVAIDVNSGRSTRERNIEETALRTNIEAAEEIARQVRLRDLAGLIVIDFIDMEETRHQRQVEHKVKDAMRSDRARIQIGRISAFGLLELSRQRLRPSLLEHSTELCPHCAGTGRIRSIESAALQALRAIEEEGVRRRAGEIVVSVPPNVALYLLNQKRRTLSEIEQRYGIAVSVEADNELHAADCEIERIRTRRDDRERPELARATYEEVGRDQVADDAEALDDGDGTAAESQTAERDEGGEEDGERDGRRRRRRRRRRSRRDGEGESADRPLAAGDDLDGEHDLGGEHDGVGEHGPNGETTVEGLEPVAAAGDADDRDMTIERDERAGEDRPDDGESDQRSAEATDETQGDEERGDRRRRRGRRGGRRRRRENGEGEGDRLEGSSPDTPPAEDTPEDHGRTEPAETTPLEAESGAFDPGPPVNIEASVPPPPTPAPHPAAPPPDVPPAVEIAPRHSQPEAAAVLEATPAPPEPPPLPPVFEPAPQAALPAAEPAPPPVPVITAPPEKPRRGWWRR